MVWSSIADPSQAGSLLLISGFGRVHRLRCSPLGDKLKTGLVIGYLPSATSPSGMPRSATLRANLKRELDQIWSSTTEGLRRKKDQMYPKGTPDTRDRGPTRLMGVWLVDLELSRLITDQEKVRKRLCPSPEV